MSLEGQLLDRKSLRMLVGKKDDIAEPGKECVAFAAPQGVRLFIGIEVDGIFPPAEHRVHTQLIDNIGERVRCRLLGYIHLWIPAKSMRE